MINLRVDVLAPGLNRKFDSRTRCTSLHCAFAKGGYPCTSPTPMLFPLMAAILSYDRRTMPGFRCTIETETLNVRALAGQ